VHVGFFTDSYFPEIDGVTYTLELWRDRLRGAGHEVSVIYPGADYEPGAGEYPVRSLPNPFYQGYRIPTLRRTSTLPDLDVVHCHGPGPIGMLGRYYARKHDVPAVYTHHTPIEEYFDQAVGSARLGGLLGRVYVPWENAFLDSFDVVTASTSRIDRDVEPVELPVGIDTDYFSPRDRRPRDLFPDGWPADRPVIGYSGRISNEKNVAEVLRVAEALPEYRFAVVGEGPYRERIEAAAPENVTVRDFLPREELPHFYSAIDAFVTASTADTLGLSTLEANACGTPVVAADVPPFDATIGPENGRRFPFGDVAAMAEAIETTLEQSLDTRGAVEQYAVSRTLTQLQTIYRDVTAGPATETPATSPASSVAGTD